MAFHLSNSELIDWNFQFCHLAVLWTCNFSRCTATSDDLTVIELHHPCAHIEMLSMAFELGTLWDEYGIISGCHSKPVTFAYVYQNLFCNNFSHSQMPFLVPDKSMKLLTQDLLHQLIKGAFKDIVSCVNDHVKAEHPT